MLQDYNKGTRLLSQKKYAKALQYFKRELKDAEFKECYLNMGNCYRFTNDDVNAFKCYLKANSMEVPFADGTRDTYPMALNNLGLLAYAHGLDDVAIEYYRTALHKDPLLKDAIWNHASASLRKFCSNETVDVDTAWRMYEYRFKRDINTTTVDASVPLWDMKSKHKSVVVLAEQGFGDKLHFGRYIDLLYNYFDVVYVQCDASLNCFFAHTKAKPFNIGLASLSGAEVGIPICSLAHKFGVIAGAWLENKFVAKKFDNSKLNVAIEWQGSPTHTNDYNRSCSPAYFQPLRKLCNLYSIRPGAPPQPGVVALNSQSWQESAEILCGMDLVISVDTSIVHLAGSLNKPCWLLQPLAETDFRWGNDTLGFDNIWYKSVEVFRNPKNWNVVFKAVERRLEQLVAARKYQQLQSTLHGLLETA